MGDQMRERRCQSLGELGEVLAHELLINAGFLDIRNLNSPVRNYHYVDFEAHRHDRSFLINVKTRNRFQVSGAENPAFNLVKKRHYDQILAMERERKAVFAWLAIQVETQQRLFSAFFGTWEQIGRSRLSIPMLPRYTVNYECLAAQKYDSRIETWLDNRGLT